MSTRSFTKDRYEWTVKIQEVKGHTPYSHQATIYREGELWATARLKHNGTMNKLMSAPYKKVSNDVWAEVGKDFAAILKAKEPNAKS